jgi:hypothetical protein
MSISSTGLYGSATIVNTDLFDDVRIYIERERAETNRLFVETVFLAAFPVPKQHSIDVYPAAYRKCPSFYISIYQDDLTSTRYHIHMYVCNTYVCM